MSLFRNISLLTLAAGLAAPLAAQHAPSGKSITLDDAMAIALKQNVAVQQAENTVELNDATVRQQKMQLLPNLSLNVSGANNLGHTFDQATGDLSTQTTQSMNTGLSSSVTLFDGGKTQASIRAAQANQQASASDLARSKQTAVFTVATDFVALANQQQQLAVQDQNLTTQQAQQDLIQKFVDAGSRPLSDLYQQQAAVASAKLAVAQARRAVELAKIDLIQALQLDPAGAYDFVAPKLGAVDTTKTFNLDSLVARAYAHRSDLKANASRVDAAAQDAKAAKAGHLPTISVTGGYNSAYSSAADLSLASQLNQRSGGSIGVGISVPLFDRGATAIAEQKAQIAAENAKLSLDSERQAVALDVRKAYLDLTSAREQLAAAQAQETAASQAADMTEKRYEAGAATLVEVTQARTSEVQAATAVTNARNNLILQQTVLSYYTGEMDPAHVTLGQ
ncbi:MAG TPA: TolC family protein [Gemmatimonadaceae bacterium]|nr:TolC family protein [Gemmatimonadaceae bacterium]